MSILGALQAGVSGLSSQSSAMGAVADNIANMNTVGYKDNNVSFSTLVTKQISSNKYSSGGVQPHASQNISSQGLLSSVSSNTSLAISGAGFFVVNSSNLGDETWAYTRAGDFLADETGYLVNSGGYYAQAWSLLPWDGTTTASTVEINGIMYMKAYKNDAGQTVYINDNIVDQTNLRGIDLSKIGGTATPTTQIAFGANLPSSTRIGDSHSVSTIVYDSLGNPANVSLNYQKASANSWNLSTSIPSGAAAVNLYNDDGEIYASAAQMEFSDVPAEGSIITIKDNGIDKNFKFTTSPTSAMDVDISSNELSTILKNFLAAVQANIRDGGRFSIDQGSIVVNQSLTGNELQFDCSKCLACVQSSADINQSTGLPTGTFKLQAIDNDLRNAAYIDATSIATGNSLTIDGTVFVFSSQPNQTASTITTAGGDIPAGSDVYYLNGQYIAQAPDYNWYDVQTAALVGDDSAVAAKKPFESVGNATGNITQDIKNLAVAIANSDIAEPERFIASGTTLEIIPSTTGANINISDITFGNTSEYIKGGASLGITTPITSNFTSHGVAQLGSSVPAVMFNSDGTPKNINVKDMEIYWANGAQDMTGAGFSGHVVEVVHVEEVQRMAASEVDFCAGIVERTDPAFPVQAAEYLVHHVRGEDAVRSFVLPAETGPERVAAGFCRRVVRQFIFLPDGDGEAFALEGFCETQDGLVLNHIPDGRDAPVFVAQVSLEPGVEVIAAADHGKPAFRAVDIVKGTVLEASHRIRCTEGFHDLDAAPGSEVRSGLRTCLQREDKNCGQEGNNTLFHNGNKDTFFP